MLKIFFILVFILLPGCVTEYNIATQKEEFIYYSVDREIALGASIAKAIEEEYELVDDPLVQERIQRVGQRIAAVCDRKDIEYSFKVIDNDEVNAISLPGGYVYCFQGLLDKIENDDQLAAVLAHEVAHIVAKHSIKKLQAAMGYSFLSILIAQSAKSSQVSRGVNAAIAQLFLGYSRQDELLADKLGARYIKLAGYNPHAMIDFLKKLDEENKRKPLGRRSYFRTHPYVPDRIRVVKQELGEEISFEDYINIEQGF